MTEPPTLRSRKERTFLLAQGTEEAVDQIRLAVGDASGMRSAVWNFWASKKGPDFYVNSSTLRRDMKGSVHPTVMNFGFLDLASTFSPPWQGPRPQNRHLERLEIPELKQDQTLHLWRVCIPGFALREPAHGVQSGKRICLLSPCTPDQRINLDMVLVQGDWRPVATGQPPGKPQAIGAIESDFGRSLAIFVSVEEIPDRLGMIEGISAQLGQARFENLPDAEDEFQAVIWMQRQPVQAITMVELHGLTVRRSNSSGSDGVANE